MGMSEESTFSRAITSPRMAPTHAGAISSCVGNIEFFEQTLGPLARDHTDPLAKRRQIATESADLSKNLSLLGCWQHHKKWTSRVAVCINDCSFAVAWIYVNRWVGVTRPRLGITEDREQVILRNFLYQALSWRHQNGALGGRSSENAPARTGRSLSE